MAWGAGVGDGVAVGGRAVLRRMAGDGIEIGLAGLQARTSRLSTMKFCQSDKNAYGNGVWRCPIAAVLENVAKQAKRGLHRLRGGRERPARGRRSAFDTAPAPSAMLHENTYMLTVLQLYAFAGLQLPCVPALPVVGPSAKE